MVMRKPIKRRTRQNHQVELQTLKAHQDEYRGRNVIVIGRKFIRSRVASKRRASSKNCERNILASPHSSLM
jgi:hypothetical protein